MRKRDSFWLPGRPTLQLVKGNRLANHRNSLPFDLGEGEGRERAELTEKEELKDDLFEDVVLVSF